MKELKYTTKKIIKSQKGKLKEEEMNKEKLQKLENKA